MEKLKQILLKKRNILCLISVIVFIVLLIQLLKLTFIPTKYMVIGIILLVFIQLLGIVLTNLKHKVTLIIGIIILTISILVNGVGIYYLNTTNNFLNKSFNNSSIKYTSTYYVVSSKSSNYTKDNIAKKEISYYEYSNNIKKALTKIKDDKKVTLTKTDDIAELFTSVKSDNTKLMLIEKNSYNIMFDLDKNLNKDDYKIVYKFKVNQTVDKTAFNDKDSYNIYIGGRDFTNSLRDLNMIVTINSKTHKILLTSIPRDYYVEVAGQNGKKDTLSYIGPLGMDTSVESIENLFDIDIDYYISVNTESLVGIVDEVGGITYCSDISYTTTHALIINDYNDSKAGHLYVKKGCQELNGIETLTVARERNAFDGRDRQRQKNNQQILIAIFNKLKTSNTITNYNNILNSVSDLYETTIPRELIDSIVSDTLNNGNKWTFDTQSVDGTDGIDYVHLTNYKDWVMYPDMNTVNTAKKKINQITK